MLPRFRPRFTYANVMATVAVFVALGGGAYAATQLPANSVGSRQIKNGAVTHPKLAANSVDSHSVVNGSLTGADIKSSSLGLVPEAAHAGGASLASNAAKLGGAPASTYLKGSASFAIVPASTSVPLSNTSCAVAGDTAPSIQVSVPASGMLEVFAKANITATSPSSLTGCLVVDGAVTGDILILGNSTGGATYYTSTAAVGGTTSPAQASWLTFFLTPGTHTIATGWTGYPSGGSVSQRELLVRSVP